MGTTTQLSYIKKELQRDVKDSLRNHQKHAIELEFPNVAFRRRKQHDKPNNLEISIKTKRQIEFDDRRQRLRQSLDKGRESS